jgi:hypothetical protein
MAPTLLRMGNQLPPGRGHWFILGHRAVSNPILIPTTLRLRENSFSTLLHKAGLGEDASI